MSRGADAPTEPRHGRALATIGTILLGTLAFAYAHGIEWMALAVWAMVLASLSSLFSATSRVVTLAARRRADSALRSTLRLKYVQIATAVTLLVVSPGLDSGIPWIEVTSSVAVTMMSLTWITCHLIVRARLFAPLTRHASLRRSVINRLLIDVSLYDTTTYVATAAILVLALWLPMTAWKVAAAHVPIPAPNEFLPLLPDGIEDVAAGARPSPSASTSAGAVDTAESPPTTVSTPSATASISWEVVCRVEPSEIFGQVQNTKVAHAMEKTWLERGANEIGCPYTVERSGRLYIVELRGGESDPSLVISDALGHAAVVFDNLTSRMDQLMSSRSVVRVSHRFTHGLGDSQIVHLKHSRCLLFTRATYDSPYVTVPPAATAALLSEASSRGEFPLVLDTTTESGTTTVEFRFEGDRLDNVHKIVVRDDGTGPTDRGVPPKAPCRSVSALMDLADGLEAVVTEEAIE